MGYTQRLSWEELRSVDSSSANFNTLWFPVGDPLQFPSYILKLVNNSNVLVFISIDGGITTVDVAPANSFWLYDEGKVGQVSAFPAMPAGTQISVQGAAVGAGDVYLVSQYIIQS